MHTLRDELATGDYPEIAALLAERDALRKALTDLRERCDGLRDEGVSGEGWQSDELRGALAAADAALMPPPDSNQERT